LRRKHRNEGRHDGGWEAMQKGRKKEGKTGSKK
jgi:hypothetical protein